MISSLPTQDLILSFYLLGYMNRILLYLTGVCWLPLSVVQFPLVAQPVAETPTGRWLKYHVEIPENGIYECHISISNTTSKDLVVWIEDHYDNPDGIIHDITGKVQLEGTGSMGKFQTYTWKDIPLEAGFHRLKIHFNQVGVGINSVRFTLVHP